MCWTTSGVMASMNSLSLQTKVATLAYLFKALCGIFKQGARETPNLLSNQRHSIPLLAPSWIAPDFDASGGDPLREFGQVLGDGALRQRRRDNNPNGTFALGIDEAVYNQWFEAFE
jgi:hypothetical protein